MGNFAENLNLGNRFRPPLFFPAWNAFFFQVKIPILTDPKQISVVLKSGKKKKIKDRKEKKRKEKKRKEKKFKKKNLLIW